MLTSPIREPLNVLFMVTKVADVAVTIDLFAEKNRK